LHGFFFVFLGHMDIHVFLLEPWFGITLTPLYSNYCDPKKISNTVCEYRDNVQNVIAETLFFRAIYTMFMSRS
jgi:hypothetical protein